MLLIDSLNFVLIRDILELILMLIQGFIIANLDVNSILFDIKYSRFETIKVIMRNFTELILIMQMLTLLFNLHILYCFFYSIQR